LAAAAAARAALPALKAILAVHWTVASGLEGNGGLLSAAGTDHRCALGCTPLVSAAAPCLFVLLGLTACLATLRRRITAIAEELLILGSKCECLSAIAAHELLISSHKSLSSMHQVSAAFEIPSNFAVVSRSIAVAVD
jgi:hypothetical protein